jgi:hypothetical protein
MKLYPDMNNSIDTNILTVITVFFYVLFVITFQAVTAVATILAAASTLIWNIYKIVMDRRDRNRAKHNGTNAKIVKKEQEKTIKNE